jgi:DNA-binding response OmpR family regulator
MTILIIDDDPDDTSLFCEAVSDLDPNATCIVAHSCENIQASIETINEVDIIFVDGHMYPIGGKACLEKLMKFVDRSRTKIIVYTGSLSPAEKIELEEIGADHILIKTASYQELKSNIGEILENHPGTPR